MNHRHYQMARAFPAGQYGDEYDYLVMQRCERLARKDQRRGDWMHNFDLATRGLSADDAEEIFWARHHRREPEFA